MRKQIAAANWKMNRTHLDAEKLRNDSLSHGISLAPDRKLLYAVPSHYLLMAKSGVAHEAGYSIAAQNCSDNKSGAFTGEVSAEMLQSIGIQFCIVGHSERREYFIESNKMLAANVNLCLEYGITPIFCCGEALAVREQ